MAQVDETCMLACDGSLKCDGSILEEGWRNSSKPAGTVPSRLYEPGKLRGMKTGGFEAAYVEVKRRAAGARGELMENEYWCCEEWNVQAPSPERCFASRRCHKIDGLACKTTSEHRTQNSPVNRRSGREICKLSWKTITYLER